MCSGNNQAGIGTMHGGNRAGTFLEISSHISICSGSLKHLRKLEQCRANGWPSWLKVSERRRKFLVLAKRQRSFPFLVFEVKEISQRVSNQALKRNRSLEPIPSSQISHSVSFCSQNSGKKTRIGNWNNTPKIGKTTWEQNLTEFVAEFEVLVSEQSEKITKIWNGDG